MVGVWMVVCRQDNSHNITQIKTCTNVIQYICFHHFLEATVGFIQTSYRVDEDIGTVEICAAVHEPQGIDCPIDFKFTLILETKDTTAGIHKHTVHFFPQMPSINFITTGNI